MSEINVVPYIDVMLVLLIIFMVAAPLVNPGQIDLPTMGQAANPPEAPLEVRIREDASLVLIDRRRGGTEENVSRNQLAGAIRSRQTEHPDLAVVIAADKNLRYQEVIRVMDVLQQNKIKRVGLLVKPADK
jgi:biopolymer transport protein TolR